MMKPTADVSVVIPTKGRPELVGKAIESIVRQTVAPKAIYVVDDNVEEHLSAETRSTVEMHAEHGAIYLKNERSPGGCGARNTGIVHAETAYVAFLDDDDIWAPTKLEVQMAYLEKVGTCVLFCGYTDLDLVFGKQVDCIPSKETYSIDDFIAGECPTSTSLAIAPRNVLHQVGLFDEALPSLQDFDLWFRCAEVAPMRTIKDILVTFVQHQGERVSLNMPRRLKALELVISKIRSNYDVSDQRLRQMRSRILYNSYASAAKKVSAKSILAGMKNAAWAIYYKPTGAKGWKWLVGAPLGKFLAARNRAQSTSRMLESS